MSIDTGISDPRLIVSVGMPVFNSAKWVGAAIESILGQTFGALELIISDNASTDNTYSICQQYASQDPRVRLFRNNENIGANRNYLAVLRGAQAPYFKWASSNDLCAPTFIERCIAALESDRSAVLACPRSWLFESSIEQASPYEKDLELTDENAAKRFIGIQHRLALNNVFNGVIRRDAMLTASRMGSYIGADIVLMSELALLGKFLLLDERLFYRRMSPETATRMKSDREIEQHLSPDARGPLQWQAWRYHLGLVRALRLARFPRREWFSAATYTLRGFAWARGKLANELLAGLRINRSVGTNS